MRSGEIALLDAGHGHITVEVAGETLEAATRLAAALRAALATEKSAPERVSISFWMRGEWGGDVRHREIDAETFAEIAGNYSAAVRVALEELIARRAPERGRLILWRGEPGTGKSHALRALVRAWTPWCSEERRGRRTASSGLAMRLYRYQSFRGAWTCFPAGQKVGNLGYYLFDNGQGRAGHGQIVARHFESIGFSNSKCTNPS